MDERFTKRFLPKVQVEEFERLHRRVPLGGWADGGRRVDGSERVTVGRDDAVEVGGVGGHRSCSCQRGGPGVTTGRVRLNLTVVL